ncbi:hypothetical protein GCM10009764_49540 [Nocardia ninae]|uniref:Uncharacterized protein n=1 Tax=Nocardia ninae NBRC 108245 TaxID=1210091 RepID=A0A511MBH0_9NOCA|nr:hypothetical protein NN4_25310 [Nocardia ninae NBRC 108245]
MNPAQSNDPSGDRPSPADWRRPDHGAALRDPAVTDRLIASSGDNLKADLRSLAPVLRGASELGTVPIRACRTS